ncbi:MAG: hypothetical protein DHS20C17_36300 [Cyclobacteriaceae bacterium]|nr:MAG: hypothetical protein DHS20C17_36300 [Cyclobacteriaceae bacterium]
MNQKFNLLLFALALFSFSALNAATITFTGGGDGTTWEDPANWDSGTVPLPADDVIITGASSVTISSVVPANSLRINMTAQLTVVNPFGVLSLNRFTNNGAMLRLNDSGRLINNGSITIVQGGGGDAIDGNNNSVVINNGFINIINAGSDVINLSNNAQFTNNSNGTIFGDRAGDGIDLNNSSDFFNHGSIYLDDFSDEGIEMSNNTSFTNTGYLSINDANNDLVCLDDNGTVFTNSGNMDLSDAGSSAIEVDDGIFTNEDGGTINASDIRSSGLNVESQGEFDNYGVISVQMNANSSGDDGVDLESNSRFRNFNILNIAISGNANANTIFLDSSTSRFRNEACGVVNMTTQHRIEIDGGAILRNEGVLATVYSGTHDNQGTLNNLGQINAPNGFNIAPNAVVGGGTINAAGAVPAQSACNINIGAIGCGGNTIYNPAQDTYTQTADGCYYVGGYATDEISYAFQELCGNGEIVARVASFVGQGWGGVMMREDLSPGSRKVSLMMNQSQVARREVRMSPGGSAFPQQFPAYGYSWVRLVRNGNYFQGYISQNGVNWAFVMNQFVPMGNCIHIGLVSTNYNQVNSTSTVIFDNVFFSSAPLITPDLPEQLDIAFEEVTEVTEVTEESISVYPNPTSGNITIEVNSARDEVVDIRVINSLGQSVKSLSLNPTETFREEVDLSGLASGMYYIHFQKADGETQIERVILNANR